MKRFEVVIQGANWEDRQQLELPIAPKEGDTIETRYGTCVVTAVEVVEGDQRGRIVCRFP